jgi:hypothetical protein
MTSENNDQSVPEQTPAAAEQQPRRADQDHPAQEAHGGSMAPGLVDDTGHRVASGPDAAGD